MEMVTAARKQDAEVAGGPAKAGEVPSSGKEAGPGLRNWCLPPTPLEAPWLPFERSRLDWPVALLLMNSSWS